MLKPELTVNCGGMFAGKSTELFRQGRRHELAGRKVVYLKPRLDQRDGKGVSSTHNGDSVKSIEVNFNQFTNQIDLITELPAVQEAQVVCIDEVQFFPTQFIRQIMRLLQLGKAVYVSGLDMDKDKVPFEITALLMAKAENVQKFRAVCAVCGEDSLYSIQTEKTNTRITVGNSYTPLCRGCAADYPGGVYIV